MITILYNVIKCIKSRLASIQYFYVTYNETRKTTPETSMYPCFCPHGALLLPLWVLGFDPEESLLGLSATSYWTGARVVVVKVHFARAILLVT